MDELDREMVYTKKTKTKYSAQDTPKSIAAEPRSNVFQHLKDAYFRLWYTFVLQEWLIFDNLYCRID